MERQRHQEPGTRESLDPTTIKFPKVPNHELPRRSDGHADITLPDLKTVLSPQFEHHTPSAAEANEISYGSPGSITSLPPIDVGAGYMNGVPKTAEVSILSPSESGGLSREEDRGRARSVVSMDERIAAEALSGLSGSGFVRSPTAATHPTSSPHEKHLHMSQQGEGEPEPLLQLFASKHPWVGGTINGSINGSMYVYNTTKHYSPRFVQNSANLVERSIATPLVNTVGSVGRLTGVEGGLRRYFDGRPPADPLRAPGKQPDGGFHDDAMEIDGEQNGGLRESTENLPAYRSSKPPSYREEYSPASVERATDARQRPNHNRSLSSRVFVMTSGLGVALSATSRQSLQFCLHTLTEGSARVDVTMKALRLVLREYDHARDSWHQRNEGAVEKGERQLDPDQDDAARRLADIIKYHSDEIWNTLKNVTNYISNYAGAALPENARHFVRSQVMSLPQRWQLVSRSQTGDSETSRSAHRMIAFATEGLDMMSQISQVVNATLQSAERWLERAGRRGHADQYMRHEYRDEKSSSMDVIEDRQTHDT